MQLLHTILVFVSVLVHYSSEMIEKKNIIIIQLQKLFEIEFHIPMLINRIDAHKMISMSAVNALFWPSPIRN